MERRSTIVLDLVRRASNYAVDLTAARGARGGRSPLRYTEHGLRRQGAQKRQPDAGVAGRAKP